MASCNYIWKHFLLSVHKIMEHLTSGDVPKRLILLSHFVDGQTKGSPHWPHPNLNPVFIYKFDVLIIMRYLAINLVF